MYGKITVNQAITRAAFAVSLPSLAIAFGFIIVAFRLNQPWYIVAAVAVGGIFITWLYWSQAGTKWQIWAYTRCDAIHELRDKALSSNVVCDESSPLNGFVFRTPADKRALAALQYRFTKTDVYHDNPAIPAETIIYFSKSANISTLILGAFFIVLGCYAAFVYGGYLIEGVLVIIFGVYCCYREFTRTKDRAPQIILNEKGIQTATIPFYSWEQIHDERIDLAVTGNNSTTAYLVYRYPGGEARIILDDIMVDSGDIEDLMHTYRIRSGKGEVYNPFSAAYKTGIIEKQMPGSGKKNHR